MLLYEWGGAVRWAEDFPPKIEWVKLPDLAHSFFPTVLSSLRSNEFHVVLKCLRVFLARAHAFPRKPGHVFG